MAADKLNPAPVYLGEKTTNTMHSKPSQQTPVMDKQIGRTARARQQIPTAGVFEGIDSIMPVYGAAGELTGINVNYRFGSLYGTVDIFPRLTVAEQIAARVFADRVRLRINQIILGGR